MTVSEMRGPLARGPYYDSCTGLLLNTNISWLRFIAYRLKCFIWIKNADYE